MSMNPDRQAYEAALRAKVAAQDFLEKPRCFDCDHLDKIAGNVCVFNGGVPDDYLYTPNECPEFALIIPF